MEKPTKTGFFEVSPGNFSIMRLAFAWLILNGTAMAYIVMLNDGTVAEAATISGSFFGVATGLKIIQKQQEKTDNGSK
jgi:hypothetical protein